VFDIAAAMTEVVRFCIPVVMVDMNDGDAAFTLLLVLLVVALVFVSVSEVVIGDGGVVVVVVDDDDMMDEAFDVC
jgi:hypothetical protein